MVAKEFDIRRTFNQIRTIFIYIEDLIILKTGIDGVFYDNNDLKISFLSLFTKIFKAPMILNLFVNILIFLSLIILLKIFI